jgi:EmrB/QacA subfamily drug resistance transporter
MAIAQRRLSANPWAVVAVLMLGTFMTLLDLTIVNVAIPSMIDGLHASLDQVLWVLNAYSLVYAVLLITSGRLGDIVGPRTMFALGAVVFTAGSVASGLAQSPTALILARAAQALGAAMMAPQPLPIFASLFPPEKRGAAFGITGALAGLAVVIGPTLGGFIVTHWGWRWIFYVNLPIGLITLLLALLVVPDLRPGVRHRLDLSGVALATAGLFCLVFGLIEGQRYNWGTVWAPITIPMIIAAGVLLLAIFLVTQARRQDREPLLPFAVFRDRNFALMAPVLAAMGFAMLGLFLPLTIYLQSVLGLSAQDAGLTIAPMTLVPMFIAPLTGTLAGRIGGKYILSGGLLLLAAGMGYIDWVAHADSARWSFLPGLLVGGVGMGCIWAPLFSVAMGTIQPHLAGVAAGVLDTVQELGGVLATASAGALLQNRLAVALHAQAAHYAGQLPPQVRGQFVVAFGHAAGSGLEVGRGQTGGSVSLPSGLPSQVVAQIQHLATAVFTHGFVDAMRPTMLLPIAVLVPAALCCLAVRRVNHAAQGQPAPMSATNPGAVA